MAILLLGGTGKTSVRCAVLLQGASIPFVLASRRGPAAAPAGMPAVVFDWTDSTTWETPFQHKFPDHSSITAIYMMAPEVVDPAAPMNAFVDFAIKNHAVKRFVFCAGSSIEPGGKGLGMVWQHLLDAGVEYCVLRPTWFMENFSEQAQKSTIQGQSRIYSACGDGRIPFVSAGDIAAVAFRALTDEKSHDTSYRILGPELLTYDQVRRRPVSSFPSSLCSRLP
jgi:ergot alkaloid biosynthesis protein